MIKERLKKNKISIMVIAAIIVAFAALSAVVAAWDEDVGDNPIIGVNEARSQLLMSGQGYSLNDKQEEEYQEKQEQLKEHIKEELTDETSAKSRMEQSIAQAKEQASSQNNGNSEGIESDQSTDDSAGGENLPGTGENDGQEPSNPGGEEISKNPTIVTSLSDGQHVSGNALTFTVKATSYKNVYLDSFDVQVYLNGQRMYSSGTDGRGVISYRADGLLVDGINEITIKATDQEGNATTLTKRIDVDINGARPVAGTVKLTVEAPSIGLGTLYSVTTEIYEGESTAAFVDRILRDAGFGIEHGGTTSYGYYLKRISKPGLTNGWIINPTVKMHLDEINAPETFNIKSNSLGEHDLYDPSGWVYSVNGSWPDGMSAITLRDGDELRIAFTLYYGYEYDGTWDDCNL